ncbi:MAG TPA: hypothetical protein PLO37_05145 [Candidatus Hydrogenedentes bacterium]|nr:hypothetical protein [Candidatus Hydrogenedentota bacterium]HPG66211.1 hypothetical protein [Candidatus Hydrogenedentota bacterium]
MVFVKTFKGYEDKTGQLDDAVNTWIGANHVKVGYVQTTLSHESGARSGSGDLIYTVVYSADAPIP